MNAVKCVFLLGLVGLLTGCLTPEEMGYLASPEPVYTTPVATPVYNTSPAYYATPVSGYSTMTVYDDYYPGYGGTHYPHHSPPPHGDRPVVHGGHGGHKGHGGPGGHGGHAGPARPGGRPGGAKPAVHTTASRPAPGGQPPARVAQPAKPSVAKPSPGKNLSMKGSQWKGGASGKVGTSGKGGTSGKVGTPGKGGTSGKGGGSHGKGTLRRRK